MHLLLLLSCDFSAASKVVDSATTPHDSDATESGATDSGEDPDDSAPEDTSPEAIDDDGDGLSEDAGDCDDDDAGVHPGADDDCDARDDDCDGDVDEDAEGDDYEPNDTVPWNLGSLEDPTEVSLSASLTTLDDVDRFQFSIVDDWTDFFTVTINLSNIPDDVAWRMTLSRLRSDDDAALGEIDSTSGADALSLSFSDDVLVEDGGDYEVAIEAVSAADCRHDYLLGIAQ